MDQPASSPAAWQYRAAALPPGQMATFRLGGGSNLPVHGLVTNWGGEYSSCVTCCPPAPSARDWPGRFLTEDGRFLLCASHGALSGPGTSARVERPCLGASLTPLAVARDGDALVITCPS